MSGEELLLLFTVVLMLLVLMVLAAAETALNRISRVKAQALAASNESRAAKSLVRLVEHPDADQRQSSLNSITSQRVVSS